MRPLAPAVQVVAHSASSGGLSTLAILLLVFAVLLLIGCAAWGLAQMQAWEPRWSLSWRHALAEAEFRSAATWREFRDWLRLGR